MASVNFDLNVPPPEEHLFDLNQLLGDMEGDTNQQEQLSQQPSKSKLRDQKRVHILITLIQLAKGDKCLKRGLKMEVASTFNVSSKTIGRIWKLYFQQTEANQLPDMGTKYHKCGLRRIQDQLSQITDIAMGDRTCIRDLAAKLPFSKSTTHRMIKRGTIKPHTNAIYPGLTHANMITRQEWVLSMLEGSTPIEKTQYLPMFNFVHIDEKWFHLSRKSQRVYLAEHERGKYRSAQSSKFIPKVMFTAAVERPRHDAHGMCTFDGKIGIFSFTYQEPAKRKSKNRAKGAIVTKLVESVTREVTRRMLIDHIVPAIKDKWPEEEGQKII